jgi:alkaline phosphatase D
MMSIWNLGVGDLLANEDQWTGYPGSRGRLLSFLRNNAISNVVVVTGDVHSSWASDVTLSDGSYDPATQEGAVAVEFVAPGITAPFEAGSIAGALKRASPHIQYLDEDLNRGYFVLDLQADKAQADWFFVDGVDIDQGDQFFGAAWAAMDGEAKAIPMSGPETDNEDTPPLAPA